MNTNCKQIIEYPNTHAKTRIALILGAIIAGLTMVSCVSQKKYDAALQEVARLSVDSTFQDYKLTDTKYAKDGVIYKQQNQLEIKSKKLDSIQSIVEKQRKDLATSKDHINTLRNAEWMTTIRDNNLVIELKNDIVFGSGENRLSPNGKAVIKSISSALLTMESPIKIWVIGHTDEQPFQTDQKDNWDLSSERAISVIRELITNGLSPEMMTASAKSKYDPKSSNKTDTGKMLNRRTEIVIATQEGPFKALEELLSQQ